MLELRYQDGTLIVFIRQDRAIKQESIKPESITQEKRLLPQNLDVDIVRVVVVRFRPDRRLTEPHVRRLLSHCFGNRLEL